MSDSKRVLELSEMPDIKPSKQEGHIRFKGAEAFALAAYCVSRAEHQPHLTIVCRGGKGQTTQTYDGFPIFLVAWPDKSDNGTTIQCHNPFGTTHKSGDVSLRLMFKQNAVTAGRNIISYIDTPEHKFPMQDYLVFRNQILSAARLRARSLSYAWKT